MKHILLVEDDAGIAGNLTALLSSEGFIISHAATQRAVSDMAAGSGFDLALVDISLPDGSGFAVYTIIKQHMDIPVIFLTASDDEASAVTGLDMGADDYITKPFRPRELVSRIRAALRRYGRTPSVFSIQGLSVDTSNGTVSRNGSEIFLSALEYRLLLVFINNPRSILTREQLLDELWDAAGEYPHSIDQTSP